MIRIKDHKKADDMSLTMKTDFRDVVAEWSCVWTPYAAVPRVMRIRVW